MSENLPPFYVGQPVVCVKSIGCYKEGNKYVIKYMGQCPYCKCWMVGAIEHGRHLSMCSHNCGCGEILSVVPYYTALAKRFAPIEENFQSISLTKVLEQETELISAN